MLVRLVRLGLGVVVVLGMRLRSRLMPRSRRLRGGKEFFQYLDQLFELCVADEKLFDLGTELRTIIRGLPVCKHIVISLHYENLAEILTSKLQEPTRLISEKDELRWINELRCWACYVDLRRRITSDLSKVTLFGGYLFSGIHLPV